MAGRTHLPPAGPFRGAMVEKRLEAVQSPRAVWRRNNTAGSVGHGLVLPVATLSFARRRGGRSRRRSRPPRSRPPWKVPAAPAVPRPQPSPPPSPRRRPSRRRRRPSQRGNDLLQSRTREHRDGNGDRRKRPKVPVSKVGIRVAGNGTRNARVFVGGNASALFLERGSTRPPRLKKHKDPDKRCCAGEEFPRKGSHSRLAGILFAREHLFGRKMRRP